MLNKNNNFNTHIHASARKLITRENDKPHFLLDVNSHTYLHSSNTNKFVFLFTYMLYTDNSKEISNLYMQMMTKRTNSSHFPFFLLHRTTD
jgi:hypothetical protein